VYGINLHSTLLAELLLSGFDSVCVCLSVCQPKQSMFLVLVLRPLLELVDFGLMTRHYRVFTKCWSSIFDLLPIPQNLPLTWVYQMTEATCGWWLATLSTSRLLLSGVQKQRDIIFRVE